MRCNRVDEIASWRREATSAQMSLNTVRQVEGSDEAVVVNSTAPVASARQVISKVRPLPSSGVAMMTARSKSVDRARPNSVKVKLDLDRGPMPEAR